MLKLMKALVVVVGPAAAGPEQQQVRLARDVASHAEARQIQRAHPHQLARGYSPATFKMPREMALGKKDLVCGHCGALKWKAESPGACCRNGKVAPPFHPPPPETLQDLHDPASAHYRQFLDNIRQYNCAFQMASMGCNQVRQAGWNPTFIIQGQVFHRIGSLLPAPDEEHKFIQIPALLPGQSAGGSGQPVRGSEPSSVPAVAEHPGGEPVRDLLPAAQAAQDGDGVRIVLSEQRRPVTEHERRFNLPASREIAVLMPNEPLGQRDIVLRLRDGPVLRISECRRSYDPLHYVLLHPYGTDGWSLEIKRALGNTPREYYNFQLRFRPIHFNIIPRSGRLFQQYLVDAQAKVETERLLYTPRSCFGRYYCGDKIVEFDAKSGIVGLSPSSLRLHT